MPCDNTELSQRDIFAAHAVTGILSGLAMMDNPGDSDVIAAWAFDVADAMVERSKAEDPAMPAVAPRLVC